MIAPQMLSKISIHQKLDSMTGKRMKSTDTYP